MTRVWERPRFNGPGLSRRFSYEGFSPRSMKEEGFRVQAKKHHLPAGEPPEGLKIVEHRRPEHTPWLDQFFQPSFLHTLRARAPDRADSIRALPFGWGLQCETEDGPDHAPLQFALGFVCAMFDHGAQAVADADTGLWFLPEDRKTIGPASEFSILKFVNVVIEPRPAPDGPYLVNTRGLVKFGRPDLVLRRVPQQFLGHAQTLLYTLSNYQAQGSQLASDESVTLKGSPRIFARPYPDDDPSRLQLNNEGLVLEDDLEENPTGDVTRWLAWWAEHSVEPRVK
jgi:hypothetical protein